MSKHSLVAVAVVGLSAAFAGPVAAAPAAPGWTMEAFGANTGPLQAPGESIPVLAVAHEIVSPRDSASGLPTGKRQHKPFVITKELDKSTPLMLEAYTTNDILTSIVLTLWRANPRNGKIEPVFTVTLTNALVASVAYGDPIHGVDVKLGVKSATGDPIHGVDIKLGVAEAVAVTYDTIEWTWLDGHISTPDVWSF